MNDEYLKHDCPEIPPVYDLFTLKTTMESGQSLIAVGVGGLTLISTVYFNN